MIGDQADIADRLRSVLPARWFGGTTPVLDTLLNGIAASWEYSYQVLQYVRAQTRISTASGVWLDLIGHDLFGKHQPRDIGQSDEAFRLILYRNILRPRATRAALTSALRNLTGQPPIVFEPRNTADTGGYGSSTPQSVTSSGGVGYCSAGGWGNLSLPFQCFVTAFRPRGNGVADVSGWGLFGGGYGCGHLEYANIDIIRGHVSDIAILNEIRNSSPAGTIVWTNIAS